MNLAGKAIASYIKEIPTTGKATPFNVKAITSYIIKMNASYTAIIFACKEIAVAWK